MHLRLRQLAAALPLLLPGLVGCEGPPRNYDAVLSYYAYDFTDAREQLRGDAMRRNDEQVLLNNVRLGMAALADGALGEAELALGRSFDLLSTAGLNEDRTVGAVLVREDVRIWKGEPFEQALAYHYVSTLYAVKQDWENMRAAAANGLFRLKDFGADQSRERMLRRAVEDDAYLDHGYDAVDTNFALGFLMQGIGSKLSGAAAGDAQLDAAAVIDPRLQELVATLKSGDYDTLLIVDYGKGPTKIAYGPDRALARFVPQERHRGAAVAMVNGRRARSADAACDVEAMAFDHRWNHLEDIRRAKSVLGTGLAVGGAVVAHHGVRQRSAETALAGLGVLVAGLLTKSGAEADTRYLEYLPQSVYVLPLRLDATAHLEVSIEGDRGSRIVFERFEPGTPGNPRTAYLRMHGRDSPEPAWLAATILRYGNDHAGVKPGDLPWILGGADVSAPTRATLEAYQRHGHVTDLTTADLEALYRAEGIVIGPGGAAVDGRRNPSFRHILEGGRGLFTPFPYSLGYKRLMYDDHGAWRPRSDAARNAAAAVGVSSAQTNPPPEDPP